MGREEIQLQEGYKLIIDPYKISELVNTFHTLQRYYEPSITPQEKDTLFFAVLGAPNVKLAIPPNEKLIAIHANTVNQELSEHPTLVFKAFSELVSYVEQLGNGSNDKKK